jgi:hypothetical protein
METFSCFLSADGVGEGGSPGTLFNNHTSSGYHTFSVTSRFPELRLKNSLQDQFKKQYEYGR